MKLTEGCSSAAAGTAKAGVTKAKGKKPKIVRRVKMILDMIRLSQLHMVNTE